MQSLSSCAKTATVRKFNSVPARKIRTAISLRFAAINFLIGRMPPAAETAGAAAEALAEEREERCVGLAGIGRSVRLGETGSNAKRVFLRNGKNKNPLETTERSQR